MTSGRRARALARRRQRTRIGVAGSIGVIVAVAAVGSMASRAANEQRRTESNPQGATSRVEVAGVSASITSAETSTNNLAAEPQPTTAVADDVERFSVVVAGDILLHMPVTSAAERIATTTTHGRRDFAPMFDRLRPMLTDADLALCHLETPLSSDGNNLTGNPVFNSAPEIATAIADAGFDGCSTASNHSFDQRESGVTATLDHLDRAGVRHTGTARSLAESEAPVLYDVGRTRVAHLAYTSFLNGAHPSESWMIDVATADRVDEVAADAAAARRAGADIVIVSVHAGNEFARAPSAHQQRLADAITAIDEVDVVVGHHAHVVQPIERRNGKWVAFGLGNLLSNQHLTGCCPIESQDGVVVRFTFALRTGTRAEITVDFVPTWVDRASEYTIVPVSVATLDPNLDSARRADFERSRERTAEAVRSAGLSIPEMPPEVVLAAKPQEPASAAHQRTGEHDLFGLIVEVAHQGRLVGGRAGVASEGMPLLEADEPIELGANLFDAGRIVVVPLDDGVAGLVEDAKNSHGRCCLSFVGSGLANPAGSERAFGPAIEHQYAGIVKRAGQAMRRATAHARLGLVPTGECDI